VDVIFNPIYPVQFALFVIDYPPNVFVQFSAMGFCNSWLAMFGTKYNLVIDLLKATYIILLDNWKSIAFAYYRCKNYLMFHFS
jgi:hypothetical protein